MKTTFRGNFFLLQFSNKFQVYLLISINYYLESRITGNLVKCFN